MAHLSAHIENLTHSQRSSDELVDLELNQRENIFESVIHRNADECTLKYIKIYTNCHYTKEQFKELQKKSTFEVTLGGAPLIQYEFDLLLELSNVKCYDNLIIIEFPPYLSTKIPLIAMQHHDARIIVSLNELIVNRIYCKINYTYYDKEIRTNLCSRYIELFTQSTTYMTKGCATWSDNLIHTFNLDISNSNVTKGYFIYGNVDLISSLQIKTNGHDRFSTYDKYDIDFVCDKITDNLLFLPYSNQKKLSYIDNSESSFVDASKCVGTTKITLTVSGDVCSYPQTKTIKIYPLIGLNVKFYGGVSCIDYVC